MMDLLNKHIVLGVTGGIAAYKGAELVRSLKEVGAEVQVVMTAAAKEFITPLTFQALSGSPVFEDLFQDNIGSAMDHIDLARWADLILIAPASANFIAKAAYGHADNLLNTLCLATQAKIVLAPAMNQQMWQNAITQENIGRLIARAVQILGPASGEQACGEQGPGRMLEADEITQVVIGLFCPEYLAGKQVLITAGPTQEALDPIRFISNYSTGKMGYALARAACDAGAKVKLISGPTHLACPQGVNRTNIVSALQMHAAVMDSIHACDIFIACGAVTDYRSDKIAVEKIKRSTDALTLRLLPNPDILADVARLVKRPVTIGFAAETQQMIANARAKLKAKGIDMIIANQVGDSLRGFATDTNEVTILTATEQRTLGLAPKAQIATKIIELIAKYINPDENGKKADTA